MVEMYDCMSAAPLYPLDCLCAQSGDGQQQIPGISHKGSINVTSCLLSGREKTFEKFYLIILQIFLKS